MKPAVTPKSPDLARENFNIWPINSSNPETKTTSTAPQYPQNMETYQTKNSPGNWQASGYTHRESRNSRVVNIPRKSPSKALSFDSAAAQAASNVGNPSESFGKHQSPALNQMFQSWRGLPARPVPSNTNSSERWPNNSNLPHIDPSATRPTQPRPPWFVDNTQNYRQNNLNNFLTQNVDQSAFYRPNNTSDFSMSANALRRQLQAWRGVVNPVNTPFDDNSNAAIAEPTIAPISSVISTEQNNAGIEEVVPSNFDEVFYPTTSQAVTTSNSYSFERRHTIAMPPQVELPIEVSPPNADDDNTAPSLPLQQSDQPHLYPYPFVDTNNLMTSSQSGSDIASGETSNSSQDITENNLKDLEPDASDVKSYLLNRGRTKRHTLSVPNASGEFRNYHRLGNGKKTGKERAGIPIGSGRYSPVRRSSDSFTQGQFIVDKMSPKNHVSYNELYKECVDLQQRIEKSSHSSIMNHDLKVINTDMKQFASNIGESFQHRMDSEQLDTVAMDVQNYPSTNSQEYEDHAGFKNNAESVGVDISNLQDNLSGNEEYNEAMTYSNSNERLPVEVIKSPWHNNNSGQIQYDQLQVMQHGQIEMVSEAIASEVPCPSIAGQPTEGPPPPLYSAYQQQREVILQNMHQQANQRLRLQYQLQRQKSIPTSKYGHNEQQAFIDSKMQRLQLQSVQGSPPQVFDKAISLTSEPENLAIGNAAPSSFVINLEDSIPITQISNNVMSGRTDYLASIQGNVQSSTSAPALSPEESPTPNLIPGNNNVQQMHSRSSQSVSANANTFHLLTPIAMDDSVLTSTSAPEFKTAERKASPHRRHYTIASTHDPRARYNEGNSISSQENSPRVNNPGRFSTIANRISSVEAGLNFFSELSNNDVKVQPPFPTEIPLNMTSLKSVQEIEKEVKHMLDNCGLSLGYKHANYHFEVKAGDIILEIEVCALADQSVNGLKLRRIAGDNWQYRKLCNELLSRLQL